MAPYNPLDKLNLGKSVAEALLDQEAHPIGGVPTFTGAGIYAIYYSGPHPAYRALARANGDGANVPIYVGKAIRVADEKGCSVRRDLRGTLSPVDFKTTQRA